MPTGIDKINEYLMQLDVSERLALSANQPGWWSASIHYAGAGGLFITSDSSELFMTGKIAQVPKQNIAPLFRRLLNLNSELLMGGVYFCVHPDDDVILIGTARALEGLDFVEFKTLLERMNRALNTYVMPLKREFGI